MGKTSFDDFLSVVESGQTKTASLNSSASGNILAKLAEELSGSAPAKEGDVIAADSKIDGAAAPVLAATEAVQAEQLRMAGGDAATAAAGEQPATAKPNQGIAISAGDGETTTANELGKTQAAVEAGAVNTSGDGQTKTAAEQQADFIGGMIADAFLDGIAKQAEYAEYTNAVELLKEAGLLDGYDIIDEGMDKTASQEEFYALNKIANNEQLTYDDMIKAAEELVELAEEEEELEKEAEDYGRDLARLYAEDLEKEASDIEAEARLAAREYAFKLEKEAADEEYKEAAEELVELAEELEIQKEASDALSGDQELSDAVAVLKSRGLI